MFVDLHDSLHDMNISHRTTDVHHTLQPLFYAFMFFDVDK